ncbi:methyltransferase [Terriglobus albidus]|uniref:Methyltransferase n=1 Tax=Terriglobus albidus TaxID=1592106 RepID=A0A5B9E6C9_9BACT|nr:class I SAM-dependent methyltransferase [Terriglobus albidus]QEE27154.1 methyltransferase [Terriglobus albidus]
MNPSTLSVLQRMEAEGAENDNRESEHARKWLNLEPETGSLLSVLLRLSRVHDVLEIGTSTGYSTICIASVLQEQGGRVTTIERDPVKQARAQANVAEADLSDYVDWRLGEATDIVAALFGPYDCVFFDADRVSAPAQLNLLLPKLSRPALLLTDNALSHPEQIQDYLRRVDELPGVIHIVIPIGKGLSVAHLP